MSSTASSVALPVLSRNRLLILAGVGWLFDAMDVGLLSFILAALRQDWGLTPTQLSWIGSINSIGMAVGALAFGIYADRYGRKSAFLVTLLLFSIASGLSAFAWSLASLMALRFLIGLGLGGELPVASTLVSESVGAHERGRVIVLLESFWAVGWILAALIAFFLIPVEWIGWRGAMLLCALPALYAWYLRRELPDSHSFTRLSTTVRRLSVIDKLRLLFAPQHRRATLVLWLVWFTVVFSYYGMFLWLPSVMMIKGFDLVKSFGYVLLMTLAQLPGYFTVAWMIDHLGRKKVLTLYLIGTMVSAFAFGASETAMQLLISGAFLSFFNLGAWGALYAYTPEQYAAQVRATGAGVAAAVGRIAGILGPLVVGYGAVFGLYSVQSLFAVFCVALFIGIVGLMIWGKETKLKELD